MFQPNTYGSRTVQRIFALIAGALVIVALALSLAQLFTGSAKAAPTTYLNFQARLRSNTGTLAVDGNYNIEFKLYDAASGGNLLWTETRTGTDRVRVFNGYLTVSLGSVTAFPNTIPWGEQLWLTMNIGGTGTPAWDGEMNPRLQLTAVPHAFRADRATVADGLTDGTNTFTSNSFIHAAPSTIQGINSANTAISVNQTGAGDLLQLQSGGSDMFTISNAGEVTLGQQGQVIRMHRSTITAPTNGADNLVIGRDGTCPGLGSCGVVLQSTTANSITISRQQVITMRTNSVDRLVVDNNGAALTGDLAVSGDLAIDTNTLYVDAANNRVSIGTTDTSRGVLTVASTIPDQAYAAGIIVTSSMNSSTNDQYGMRLEPVVSPSSASSRTYGGFFAGPYSSSSNVASATIMGMSGFPFYDGTGTLGNAMGVHGRIFNNQATGTINNAFALRADNAVNNGTITNNYGVYVENQTAGTNNYGLYIQGASTYALWVDSGVSRFDGAVELTSVSGAGLTDCDDAVNSKLLWDSATGTFSCGTDGSGGVGAGIVGIGTINSATKSANGAVINGSDELILQTADATNPGLVSTGAQTFAGDKTFNGALTLAAAGTGLNVTNSAIIGGTLAVGGQLTVGTSDTTGTLLVLDTKTNSGDPSGTNGAMYYNSNAGKFRCYEGGAWKDCITAGGSGITGVGTFVAANSYANGATVSGSDIILGSATQTNPGIVNNTTQTFGGSKTFNDNLLVNGNTTIGNASGDSLSISAQTTISRGGQAGGNDYSLGLTGAPVANGSSALLRIGNALGAGSGGVSGNSTYGTLLSMNQTSYADYLHFQWDGYTKFKVDVSGNTTIDGTLSVVGATTLSNTTVGGTLAVSGNLTIGASNTTGTLLVLDTKTNSGDPSGTNGAMYYNSNAGKFRCYEGGGWKDCITAGGSGITGVGTFVAGNSYANGATVSGNNIILGSATQTNPGIVNATDQTFGGNKTFSGNLTVSAAAPNSALGAIGLINGNLTSTTNDQIGLRVNPTIAPGSSSSRVYSGIFGNPTTSSTNLATSSIYGVTGSVETYGTGTFGILAALFGQNSVNSGTTANASAGLAVYNPNGTGTINTNYGIYLQNQTRGATNYGLYIEGASTNAIHVAAGSSYFGGQLTIGTYDTTGTLLVLDTKTNSGDPSGTNGAMYYNSSLGKFRCYEGGTWKDCIATTGGGLLTGRKVLVPEYPGAVLTANGAGATAGSMTSDYVSGLSSGQGYKHNYYEWTSANGALQEYTILVNHQLPSDFSSFVSGSFKAWAYATNTSTSNNDILIQMRDADGTVCLASDSVLPGSASTWAQDTLTNPTTGGSCSYAANDIVTFEIRVLARSGNTVRIGEIQFDYNK